jgi:uncharacterized protein YbdZ (MbtH family)
MTVAMYITQIQKSLWARLLRIATGFCFVVAQSNRARACGRCLPGIWKKMKPQRRARDARPAKRRSATSFSTDCWAVYSIPRISQVQLMYRARLDTEQFGAGAESLEVKLFDWDDIPWTEIAFPSAGWALQHHHELGGGKVFAPFSNPPGQTGNFPQSG